MTAQRASGLRRASGPEVTSGSIELRCLSTDMARHPTIVEGVAFERLAWLRGWDQICVSHPAGVL